MDSELDTLLMTFIIVKLEVREHLFKCSLKKYLKYYVILMKSIIYNNKKKSDIFILCIVSISFLQS